jgi:S1-C subfamily serine protease
VEQILQAEGIEGVWVSDVGGGAAARAGIDPGDVITEVAGEPVQKVDEVRSALRSAERGTSVEVEGLFVASGDPTDFLDAWRAEVEIPAGSAGRD